MSLVCWMMGGVGRRGCPVLRVRCLVLTCRASGGRRGRELGLGWLSLRLIMSIVLTLVKEISE